MSKTVLPMFASRSFIVSGLTFRSLIHLEVFFYGMRKYSNFILLHVAVQFSQHHLLKRLSFPHYIFLALLSYINWPYMCGFISGHSILYDWFVCLYTSTILFWLLWLCNIVWNQGAWCLQLCCSFSRLLWLFGVFCGSIQILDCLFYFCKKCHWNFYRDCI